MTLLVPEDSVVLNIVLHLVYNIPVEKYGPSVENIASAFVTLSKYGLPTPDEFSNVWTILKRHATDKPYHVYALGAYGHIESLCKYASEFTLEISLSVLSERDVLTMGASLLRRLFFLHLGRETALKRIISSPPEIHQVMQGCSLEAQIETTRSWRIATREVLLDDMPQNMASGILVSTYGPLVSATHCMQCKISIQLRMSKMIEEWEAVKRTI